MPVNYVAEMLCDRIAACEVYRGKNYTSAAPMEYYEFTKKYITIHPETRALLEKLLTILKDGGEESAYAYIRKLLKREAIKTGFPFSCLFCCVLSCFGLLTLLETGSLR